MKRWLAMAGVLLLAAGARAGELQRVLVTPFNVLNIPDSQKWIGTGVQENIVAEMGREGTYNPITFQGQVMVEDNATAARLGRNAQSPLAIRGTAQMVGNDLRLTAQLIDSKTGDTVRTASVTGSLDRLLRLEDQLAAQLMGKPDPVSPGTSAPQTAPVVQTPAPAPPQVIIIQQPQASYPYYPSYPVYAYPSYGFPVYFTQVRFDTQCVPPVLLPGQVPCDVGLQWYHTTTPSSGGIGLPIPNNNVLPIPNNNVLPLPGNNVRPAPRASGGLVPVSAPAAQLPGAKSAPGSRRR